MVVCASNLCQAGHVGEQAEQRMWANVVALHARIERELGRAIAQRHGLGLSEFRALRRLAEEDDGILRMQVLAEAIGLEQSSVTRLVGRLEVQGLTAREVCADDRRGIYSVITDRGREVQAAIAETYAETLRAALDEAANDPALATEVGALRQLT
jgi:DNA-binding MarR family transcriptional regulator